MSLRLGVLDQSPIISGFTPRQAVQETVELAQLAEQMGYSRYWMAEHHAISALADPCPEILLTRVASVTSRIRVGTGGVLLPYYSPLKVAEQFRMLEALFPGRVDLGLGRAPGGDQRTAAAMSDGPSGRGYRGADRFPEQVMDLVGYLDNSLPASHAFAKVKAMPAAAGDEGAPEVWLLGSSDYSAALAAQLGLRFGFAHFINAHGGDAVSRAFREQYRPSAREPKPATAVCCFVICADTFDEAERLARSVDLRRLHMAYGVDHPVPNQAEADAHKYTDRERLYIEQQRARLIHGDPSQVKDKLLKLADDFQADELLVLCITSDYASRRKSYELVARTFGLA